MNEERNRRRQVMGAVAAVVLAWLGYGFYQIFTAPEGFRSFFLSGGAGGGTADIGGAFDLVDQNGKTRTDGGFRGQLTLVFFGYTNCPDVCPIGLQTMTDALVELGEAGHVVRPIFITVDPERDTPERLKEFAANFHPRLVALTGSEEQIARVAKAYRVYYAKAKPKDGTHGGHAHGDYLMDHSSFIYLMGADGRYLTHFPSNVSAADLLQGLKRYI